MIPVSGIKTSIGITGVLKTKKKKNWVDTNFKKIVSENFSKRMKDFKPHIQLIQSTVNVSSKCKEKKTRYI